MFHLPTPIEGNSGEPVGIKTHIVSSGSQGYEYTIFRYNQQTSEGTVEPYTVVTNTDNTKVFAYMAPRETLELTRFKNDYQEDDVVEVKESIEGTMITFFWNDETEEWDICTRNGVGCNYSFAHPIKKGCSKPKTFREMVIDAFRVAAVIENFGNMGSIHDLKDVVALENLSKTHCYTCILQHPANHIVYERSPFSAFLKLVSIYEVGAMPPLVDPGSDITYRDCVRELATPDFKQQYLQDSKEDDQIWETGYSVFSRPGTKLEYIQTFSDLLKFKTGIFDIYKYKTITNKCKIYARDMEEHDRSLYYPPGWILTNTRTGQRCEIKNPFYEEAKLLRNMQPNMFYQYLEIRSSNLVEDYLLAFPQYKPEFTYFENEYEQFVTEVHSAYVKFYIRKERDNCIPKQYFVHAARIHHNVYLTQQVPRRKVNRETVYDYFKQFSPTKMFYFLTHTEEHNEQPDTEVAETYSH